MKRFIDKDGTFEIKIPFTWRHLLIDGKVHTFQEYELWKSDTFQVSVRKIENKNNAVESLPVIKINGIEYHSLPDVKGKGFITKTWMRFFGEKLVIFTLTFFDNASSDSEEELIKERVKTAHSIISSFRLIDRSRSVAEINFYRFDMFLQGVGATSIILNKAIENKSFIETVCILANQIDALLRTGIILKKQIINKNTEIESEWIYQGLDDEKKSEKDIYKKALELKIINQNNFDELYKLYEDRNKVIHRFIISEITIAEVEEIAFKYYKKLEMINKIIYDIESEQIKLGIGMTTDKNKGAKRFNPLEYIKGKIGKSDYLENLTKENRPSKFKS